MVIRLSLKKTSPSAFNDILHILNRTIAKLIVNTFVAQFFPQIYSGKLTKVLKESLKRRLTFQKSENYGCHFLLFRCKISLPPL